jgi:hypothetical protein
VNLKDVIPKPEAMLREGVVVLAGVLLAAFILSRFPKLQAFVANNSVTVKDDTGNILF